MNIKKKTKSLKKPTIPIILAILCAVLFFQYVYKSPPSVLSLISADAASGASLDNSSHTSMSDNIYEGKAFRMPEGLSDSIVRQFMQNREKAL